MHVAPHPHGSPPSRCRPHAAWRLTALIYTALGVACLAACAALPGNEMAMLAAIAGGLPWSLALGTLELSPGVAQLALLILTAAWAVNGTLLWWLALRRPGAAPD
jgi:hypothetical protein